MKIKRISEITAVFLFIAFLLLLIFSHRQSLFTDTTMNVFNTGWTYSYQDQEGDTVLPASLDVPKDTEVVFANTIPEEVGDNYALVFRTRIAECQSLHRRPADLSVSRPGSDRQRDPQCVELCQAVRE